MVKAGAENERQLKGLILFFAIRLFNTIMFHTRRPTRLFSISRDKHFLQSFIAFKTFVLSQIVRFAME